MNAATKLTTRLFFLIVLSLTLISCDVAISETPPTPAPVSHLTTNMVCVDGDCRLDIELAAIEKSGNFVIDVISEAAVAFSNGNSAEISINQNGRIVTIQPNEGIAQHGKRTYSLPFSLANDTALAGEYMINTQAFQLPRTIDQLPIDTKTDVVYVVNSAENGLRLTNLDTFNTTYTNNLQAGALASDYGLIVPENSQTGTLLVRVRSMVDGFLPTFTLSVMSGVEFLPAPFVDVQNPRVANLNWGDLTPMTIGGSRIVELPIQLTAADPGVFTLFATQTTATTQHEIVPLQVEAKQTEAGMVITTIQHPAPKVIAELPSTPPERTMVEQQDKPTTPVVSGTREVVVDALIHINDLFERDYAGSDLTLTELETFARNENHLLDHDHGWLKPGITYVLPAVAQISAQ